MPNQLSFRYFKTSPEIIQLAVMLYVRLPLSLRNVEDLLYERGVDVSYESVRYWWHRFGSKFASEIKKRRAGVCDLPHLIVPRRLLVHDWPLVHRYDIVDA